MTTRKHNFASYNVDSLAGFKKASTLLGEEWFFRGHEKSQWDLSSTLERDIIRLERKRFGTFEAFTLEQIKSGKFLPKSDIKLRPDDPFSQLALLQHHGCKTRLVDFTRSIEVALFFAFSDAPDEHDLCNHSTAAIWAIKKSDLEAKVRLLAQNAGWKGTPEQLSRHLVQRCISNATSRHPWKHDELAVVFAEPAKVNPRMQAQKGLFLAPLNLRESFKVNLSKGLGLTGTKEPIRKLKDLAQLKTAVAEESVVKLRFPKKLRIAMLAYLKSKGITAESLFPDFDGYVRSLNYQTVFMGGRKL